MFECCDEQHSPWTENSDAFQSLLRPLAALYASPLATCLVWIRSCSQMYTQVRLGECLARVRSLGRLA